MNDLELLTTTLERRRSQARDVAARVEELAGIIAAYEVVLADLQGLPPDAPQPAAESVRDRETASQPEVEAERGPEPDNEVANLVAQIDTSTPYREMTTADRDAWIPANADLLRELFEIVSYGTISQALGIPSGSCTAVKKKVGLQVDPTFGRDGEQTPPEVQSTPSENGVPPAETGRCAHQWDIATPNGPTSQGVCSLCGETKDFANSQPHSGWERTPKEDPA